ncbi:DHA2 family multidrug resistance protein-like MFS transporter [Nocardiopsis mwathae]|uniref:DHA2 family multidrug resistance protein-like MFS transporter n=1 Tax=Nocardiopsis mwathae TaxID=1472723 RepID=A0A7W9YEZ2_9ACTN|nr:MFS transporter [Nocardiopsis mwathae]MBB6170950.1 DHA2 family multidrug resistance protein-like MFS transporter [Nocardiopsis mwathae]
MSSADAPRSAPSSTTPRRATPREWAALAVLTLPVLLISVDMTVLGFAVPHLSRDLAPTSVQLLWIVDVYALVLASLLVTMGALGDRVGRRNLLMVGAAGFGVASLAAAFAPNAEAMIAARALLGLAGSTLMPSTLALIRNIFRDDVQRKFAIAVWSSALAGGSALGPVLGGALLEFFWWGSLFLINVPVTVLTLVLTPFLVREYRAAHPAPIDAASALLVSATVFPAVYGVKKLAEQGLAPVPLMLVAVGVFFGCVFVRRQLRRDNPMLDMRLFTIRAFSVGVWLNLLTLFTMIAGLFFLTQFLQIVLGISPLRAGLALLPGLMLSIVASFLAVGAATRLGFRGTLTAGLTLMAGGFAVLSQLPQGSAAVAVAGFALICFGMGLTQTLTNDAVVGSVPEERVGAASAVSETGYELGAALGIAILGSVLWASYASAIRNVDGVPGEAMETARDTLGGAVHTAESLAPEAANALVTAAHVAFVDAIHVTSTVAAVILALAAIHTAWVLRPAAPAPDRAPR